MKYWKLIRRLTPLALLLVIGISFFTASRSWQKERSAYADSLNYHKTVLQANDLLLDNKFAEALKLYEKAETLQPYHYWSGKANKYVFNYHRFLLAKDSLAKQNQQLFRKIAEKGMLVKQFDEDLNRTCFLNDSLLNVLLNVASAKQELEAVNSELQETVAALRNDHGRLQFKVKKAEVCYYGEIRNNMACGSGIGIFDSKGVYDGQWLENLRHGNGRYTWANGDVYEGEFVNGNREGTGTYYFASGEKYVGQWKNDLREGNGMMLDKNNEVLLSGQWISDRFQRQPEVTAILEDNN